ncbi:hypothetical protein PX860_26820 (plasmid) [Agrobacterium leguminum]|uniref:hypothetical protein n=1 Tax=Agrobacterium leguminum TaxID=2792015 RepID=UPI00272AE32F|nr:hypothetical protein [Agrobacterium leguminum]WLE00507.1 hypothetical protein PX860_26820 [Agrobacterium leguminum]
MTGLTSKATGLANGGGVSEMMQGRENVSNQSFPLGGDLVFSEGYADFASDPPLISMALTYRPPQSGPVMSAAPIAGHRTGHVFPHQRAPSLFPQLRRFIRWGRESGANRFHKPSDWLRIVALGVILLDFALLSFANRFLEQNFEGYLPGLGSILGGLLFAIIILRLARPVFYPDWIAIGVLQTTMGCVVSIDPQLQSAGAFLVVCSLLIALSGLRIWTGETIRPRRGAVSLLAGGYTTLFLLLWLIADRCFLLGTGADMILAADLLVTGFTVILWGLSLRTDKGQPVL